ncbi:hypothetical protein BDV32DRAFT_131689 [Aspergillus pseudonomiae]|uniref:Uncharacterized protein n=1 Tax=Aspergillus pseudonomiae TaxID=1506151 RepID=A0A5N6HKG9_9EURO|nr:uncharacterized protein BDV37DRAFT_167090 [Aspergillus pseudonomiae]KAB8254795.1 hypothetical protein BDV32DRAFT_131689 [Aspergillus pseudonomiae]KAE8402020.1 hypothetical protein BDV37DRAFT_167090 [Aspergillus pseudonomiae]
MIPTRVRVEGRGIGVGRVWNSTEKILLYDVWDCVGRFARLAACWVCSSGCHSAGEGRGSARLGSYCWGAMSASVLWGFLGIAFLGADIALG